MEECTILWSVKVDHQLFAVSKMDVLGDNREEVIVCAWDGQTYIVDHDRNVVRYHFHKNVQSFSAGKFSYDQHNNHPSLAYADSNNRVWLYYDVRLPFLHASDLTTEAQREMADVFDKFAITEHKDKKEILRYFLYDLPAKKQHKIMRIERERRLEEMAEKERADLERKDKELKEKVQKEKEVKI